jgi:hypothetical protein
VTVTGVYAQTIRTLTRDAGVLVLLGALVFVPLGLLDAAANRAGSIHVEDLGDLPDLAVGALVVGFAAQAITSLLGEVFYSGAVALTIARAEPGGRPSLLAIARSLSYGRLIAVDVLFGVTVVIGLVLFVVPGVVAFTWFALAGPLVELEGAGVKESFTRSRRLVRGRFWTVLAILGPITLASELLTDAVLGLIHGAIHDAFLGDWIGESVTNIAISPLYAVAAVVVALDPRQSAYVATR